MNGAEGIGGDFLKDVMMSAKNFKVALVEPQISQHDYAERGWLPDRAGLDLDQGRMQISTGLLHEDAQGRLAVELFGGLAPVEIAASCLLRPRANDLVAFGWLGRSGESSAWVLHVLRRDSATTAQIQFPDESVLEATGSGKLGIRSADLRVETERLEVQASVGLLRGKTFEMVADTWLSIINQVDAVWSTAKFMGQSWLSIFDRHHSHAREHRRLSEDVDATSAGIVEIRGKDIATVQGPHVAVEGEKLVKVRGSQIHMG
jgi:Protein of unknown function (DUF3540)